jgi:hypothetical protein
LQIVRDVASALASFVSENAMVGTWTVALVSRSKKYFQGRSIWMMLMTDSNKNRTIRRTEHGKRTRDGTLLDTGLLCAVGAVLSVEQKETSHAWVASPGWKAHESEHAWHYGNLWTNNDGFLGLKLGAHICLR